MLATEAKVKSEGNLPDSIKVEKITPHLVKASKKIKGLLTPELYAKIEGYATSQDPKEKETFDDCQIAEANLAMSFAVKVLNIQTQGNGLVRVQGWDENRSENLSQKETDSLAEHFEKVAMDLLAPFIPQEVPADPADVPGTVVKGRFAMGAI
ncbi:MAG TPA: hypothetical protein VHO03_17290 [Ignavibacteriales bacterium]|nr:hypothetical protein [Ignavibacteriales bacterium]